MFPFSVFQLGHMTEVFKPVLQWFWSSNKALWGGIGDMPPKSSCPRGVVSMWELKRHKSLSTWNCVQWCCSWEASFMAISPSVDCGKKIFSFQVRQVVSCKHSNEKLTTRVIPEDTTRPTPEIIASRSVQNLHNCHWGQSSIYLSSTDQFWHAVIHMLLCSYTIDAKDYQWKHKEKTEKDAQNLAQIRIHQALQKLLKTNSTHLTCDILSSGQWLPYQHVRFSTRTEFILKYNDKMRWHTKLSRKEGNLHLYSENWV